MPWIFGGREARRREQKHECLALLLLSLSLSRRHWNGPKPGKGGWIRDLKVLMEDGDRFLEGGFSPKNGFPAVRYNAYAIDRSRSKDSENIHRCF